MTFHEVNRDNSDLIKEITVHPDGSATVKFRFAMFPSKVDDPETLREYCSLQREEIKKAVARMERSNYGPKKDVQQHRHG